MIKLKTKKFIKDLDNKDIEDLSVGKALANIILAAKSDPLRSYVMASKIYTDEVVELSASDFDWIKQCVTDHSKDVYGNSLVPGQLLLILSEIKDEDKIERKSKKD